MPLTRLQDYEVIVDNEVTYDGDFFHFPLLADAEPINHDEVMKSEVWENAMIEELASIKRNHTWQLFKLPSNTKAIEVNQVYKLEHNLDSSIAK